MTLAPGTRLGPYEIVGWIGAGGMGEVFRAHDTRLGRDVAIKVLSGHLSASPEVRARFEREARAISQLNHPHICTLHDIGHQEGIDYLVMEYLEGETLASRLEEGPLPLPEVLRHGIEIASALDVAHRSGIVHRDLKPGNVMLTKSGVKLMDFGLARATGLTSVTGSLTQSPTVSQPLTAEGTIVGTFQYMAPEQLEGKEADARADLWALGCVLYEMATGRRAFEGTSRASLIAAILKDTPRPISDLQPLTPPALDRVARQCLAKDPDERWQSARDVASELLWISTTGAESKPSPPVAGRARRRQERFAWTVAAVMAIAAVAITASALWIRGHATAKDRSLYAAILHDGEGVIDNAPTNVAISPDGRRIAYVVWETGITRLWVRDLDGQTPRRLSALDSVQFPFWSADGRWVAFFTEGEPARLWKVPAEGGAPVSLCTLAQGAGGSWGKTDVIVFAPTPSGPLYRIPAAGGSPEPATLLDAARKQTGHRMPWFLPDGVHFLYSTLPRVGPDVEVFVGCLGSKDVKRIMAAASGATYAEPGYLLFERDRKLVARRFDASRLELTGEPVPLGDLPLASGGWEASWIATASNDDRLASLRSWPQRTEVEWVDRSGGRLRRVVLPPGRWEDVTLAPNGRSALASRPISQLRNEVWLFDLEGVPAERVSPRESDSGNPRWAPDGRSFVYLADATGRREIYRQDAERATPAMAIASLQAWNKWPCGFTPDGSGLLAGAYDPVVGLSLWRVPIRGGGAPTVLLRKPDWDSDGAISPDGRWLAYTSTETGQREVFVTSFPTVGRRTRLSTSGGQTPIWTRGGRELLFVAPEGRDASVMSVPVESGAAFTAGAPRALVTRRGLVSFSAAQDGERLLLSVESGETPPPYIGLTLNWTAALEGR